MKIIYCLAGTFNSGGMERIVIEKANWLADHGNDVLIITTEQNGRTDFFRLHEGVRRIDLDIMYSRTNGYNTVSKFIARNKLLFQHKKMLEKVLLEEKADIVVSTFGNEVGLLPEINDNSKKIAEIHFSRWYRLQLNRKGIWGLIDKYLTYTDHNVLSKYDKFVCLTEEDKLNWGRVDNIEVIPNFIESNYVKRAQLETRQMIAVGRLSYQKGYDRMLAAWSRVVEKHPDWILNIFGGGELKVELEQMIDSLDLNGKVILHLPTNEIEKEYLSNSALVLSSHYEGLPMVFLEAMNFGLPLISFDCKCGPKDVIKDGVNGLLVEEGDIDGLANAIIQVIESDGLRKRLGNGAYSESKRYVKDIIMERWVNLFNSIV